MRLHRFIIDFDTKKEEIVLQDHDIISQIKKVFRLRVGDSIILVPKIREVKNNGFLEFEYSILDINNYFMSLKKERNIISFRENDIVSTLCLSILKQDHFEYSVQKCVELGVNFIQPFISQRTIKKDINIKRLNSIIKEAVEQSGRSILPVLLPTLEYKSAISSQIKINDYIYIASLNSENKDIIKNSKRNSIFIGPEGGFTKDEEEFAFDLGVISLSLSKTILRADTASIVATSKII